MAGLFATTFPTRVLLYCSSGMKTHRNTHEKHQEAEVVLFEGLFGRIGIEVLTRVKVETAHFLHCEEIVESEHFC